jgi:hypothetical protein
MARVFGETARYVTKQAIKKFQMQVLTIFLVICLFAFVLGYFIGKPYGPVPFILLIVIITGGIGVMLRITSKLEQERLCFRKGVTGEAMIGYVLESFPDDYRIIHDLTTPFGNIDHVVVGPTGAYVIDAKNWKGVVTANGSGELLLNGKPTQKPEVKNLTRTIMSVKDKIKVLAGSDPYIKGIFAFPSAHIEARWGTTGAVDCVTDEKLYDYIVETKKGSKLSKQEIDSISQAFLALARMDKDFG